MASSKKRAAASGKAREDVELGGDIDALFTKPLRDFTEARNELAKSLRKAGDRARAAQVAATKKPSVAAWTLNQLARRYPQRMDSLLEAGERLRDAQRGALEPGGAKGLREASLAHRALVNELLRAAPSLLEEAGYRAGGGNLDRVRDSLLAAPTARREDLERLERGQLTEEIEPGDLTDVLGLMSGRPAARPQEEAKPRAVEGGGKAKKAAPVKAREAKPKAEKPKAEKPKAEKPKAEKPKRKAAEARPAKTSKAAEREEKKRLAAEQRDEKKRAAQEREEKKKLAAQEREEKKRLAAEERDEKKRLAAEQRDEKKRLAGARRERDQAGREAARAAKEADRRSREAERLMRAAEEAADAAKRAMELAREAERDAREAQEQAEEAARRLEAAERALDE